VKHEWNLLFPFPEKIAKPAGVIEMPVTQDNRFDVPEVTVKVPGIMEKADRRQPGIHQDTVFPPPGENGDKAGQAMFCEQGTGGGERRAVISCHSGRDEQIDVIVDKYGHIDPL